MLLEEILSTLERVCESIDMPITLTDKKLEILWANAEALRCFPSLSFKSGISDLLSSFNTEKMVSILKQGKVFSSDKMSEPFNIMRLSAFPLIEGDLVGCLFVFNTKHMEYDILNDEVQENIIRAFTDSYKMPLTIIFSTLGLMARNADKGDDMTKNYLKLVTQNCYRMFRLSNNISEEVKFSSGIAKLKLKNGDLGAFLKGLYEASGVLTSAIDIPLKLELPDKKVITAFDSDKVSTAILNLVSNACKFTREGNHITLKLDVMNDNAVISVSDAGIGIKDEIAGHIFDPYFSFDPCGRPFSGNGLGLTIVKHIIAMHGGTVAVSSRENEGAKVAFTLPIKVEEGLPDYAAENGIDYLADRFSPVFIELSDVCGTPMP